MIEYVVSILRWPLPLSANLACNTDKPVQCAVFFFYEIFFSSSVYVNIFVVFTAVDRSVLLIRRLFDRFSSIVDQRSSFCYYGRPLLLRRAISFFLLQRTNYRSRRSVYLVFPASSTTRFTTCVFILSLLIYQLRF